MVEERFNGSYSRHIYDFEENKSCVINTYKLMKSIFPEFDLYIPENLLSEMND